MRCNILCASAVMLAAAQPVFSVGTAVSENPVTENPVTENPGIGTSGTENPTTETSAMVTTIAGEQLAGVVTTWNTAGIALQTKGKVQELTQEQLLRISWQQDEADAPMQTSPSLAQRWAILGLVDDTILPITQLEVIGRQAKVTSPLSATELLIPLDHIRFVQFSTEPDVAAKLQMKLDSSQLDGDLLVIQKKGSGQLDFLSGLIGDISADQVEFTWEGEPIPVRRSKIAALAYYHARPPQLRETVCSMTTHGGARLPAAGVLQVGENLQLTTPCGLKLEIPRHALKDADYSSGKLVYLSDLKPIRQKWIPRIGLPASAKLIAQHGWPRLDQSFAGSALSLVWPESATGNGEIGNRNTIHPITSNPNTGNRELKIYSKGLALRSRTELRYRVPKEMHRFLCLAGMDPATAQQGHVELTISADGQILWQGEISGDAAPVEIEVELAAARQLEILVDYGANLDFGDRLHLVEARVSQ